MQLRGLKYTGNKDVGVLQVMRLSPTDPDRRQVFQRGEVKLLGKHIDSEIAQYLAAEYRGVVEYVDVEVDARLEASEAFASLRSKFKGELTTDEFTEVFCREFGIDGPLEKLEKKNKELEKALKELSELKAKAKAKAPVRKRTTPAKKK